MDEAQIIRDSVAHVAQLRAIAKDDAELTDAVAAVKNYQSRRFEHSYRDLIAGGPYQTAARFFLDELYGNVDYSRRDEQFSRIAGAIERLLPQQAAATAVSLARLHALTEGLDQQMGMAWRGDASSTTDVERYCKAWTKVGQPDLRAQQLDLVMTIGQDLDKLTKTRGLRLLLRLMHGPAQAAGLLDLQRFLEIGFDTFAQMGRLPSGATGFLRLINARESELINALFAAEFNEAGVVISRLLPDDSNSIDAY